MKLPKIDIKEVKMERERNFREKLKFISWYANWVKKTPNKKWSSLQKKLIDSQLKKK